MARIAFIFAIALVIAGLVLWAWNWVKKNQVRFRIERPPNAREMYLIGAVFQVIRRLVRIFFRI